MIFLHPKQDEGVIFIMFKIETHAIVTAIEQISSDLAQLEEMLRKEDSVIAEALCKLIGRIFWGIEKPLLDDCPSLCPLVRVGEKYKKCGCRIVEFDRRTSACRVIKSGIPAEEAIPTTVPFLISKIK